MFSIIVAVDEQNWIWADNKLLCHLSDDLKNFKKITEWHTVIMWRNTFLSLPNGTLPNRTNIVLSKSCYDFDGCIHCKSVEECLDLAEVNGDKEVFIIWWASVYKIFFEMAERLYVTRIQHIFKDADVFFPEIKKLDWEIVFKWEKHSADEKNEYPFTFEIYERLK